MAQQRLLDSPRELGVVAYLNMLPWTRLVEPSYLFSSPRELNSAAREKRLAAGCMSAIAGLAAGYTPVEPFFGVGAESFVQSVYLEPCAADPSSFDLWSQIIRDNKDRVKSLMRETCGGIRQNAPVLSVPPVSADLVIFSSGASEQSEWLFKTLLRLQGICCEIVYVEESWNTLSPTEVHAEMLQRAPETLSAFLVIGDPALQRLAKWPRVPLPRIDLAHFWREASGLPCIFALWFHTEAGVSAHREGFAELERMGRCWETASLAVRRSWLATFCESTGRNLESLGGVEGCLDYLSRLAYRLDGRYERTLSLYRALMQVKGLSENPEVDAREASVDAADTLVCEETETDA